jgi:plasmid stabilization system protein ParE
VKHTIRPAARDDIIRQFRYYLVDRDKPEVANRFLEAVDKSVEKILRTPNAGVPKHLSNPSLAGLRSWPVEEFEDIRIYYLAQGDEVRVIRVLHGKRDIARILEREE